MKFFIMALMALSAAGLMSGCRTAGTGDRDIASRQLFDDIEMMKQQVDKVSVVEEQLTALKEKIARQDQQINWLKKYISDLSRESATANFSPQSYQPPGANSSGTGQGAAAEPDSRTDEGSGEFYIHQVENGQTLSSIARKYKVKISDIKKANRLSSDLIRIDQKLYIPKK